MFLYNLILNNEGVSRATLFLSINFVLGLERAVKALLNLKKCQSCNELLNSVAIVSFNFMEKHQNIHTLHNNKPRHVTCFRQLYKDMLRFSGILDIFT